MKYLYNKYKLTIKDKFNLKLVISKNYKQKFFK